MTSNTAPLSRNEQLKKYSPIVHRAAYHMVSRLPASVEVDDLIQAGMIGLCDAMDRCVPEEGELEKYAMPRIRGAMIDELRECDWMPRGSRRSRRDIDGAVQRLQQRLLRQLVAQEVASELHLDIQAYHALMGKVHLMQLVHMEDIDQLDDEGESVLDGAFGDWHADPLSQIENQRRRKALVEAIVGLPQREQYVIVECYVNDRKLREIALDLDVTESRVCQLRSNAITMLRARLQAH
ncbi:RNA polymerase sigma factor, FliA/WhiG family protein [Hydrogenophaga sp. RAC07]|uniref:FliA/WhiG family RNA polymerase sigma factor n=1 Tax=Hydrogenophaga sp. RAC07 TaxID=1842537 RepID=UPI00083CA7C6|nr:FliA/WhiG family RNA polymerase sigma factor [Hydrogenophaga sp. RAC07]AOF85701.1 RNA polymerase sigma factor, FliA/WhiG family protein [Hydrogenophaga sp. RAC07]